MVGTCATVAQRRDGGSSRNRSDGFQTDRYRRRSRRPSQERPQLRLYTEWPDFIYQRSGSLNGQQRLVTPKTPHAGAQYLLIDDRPAQEPRSGLLDLAGTYPAGCCMPDEALYDHSDLASELFSLLLFRTGRPFDDRTAALQTQDWSRVVWDLLDAGVRKSFNRKNSGRRNAPRFAGGSAARLDGAMLATGTSPVASLTATEILGSNGARLLFSAQDGEPPGDGERDMRDEESEPGVSVVLIETSERTPEG